MLRELPSRWLAVGETTSNNDRKEDENENRLFVRRVVLEKTERRRKRDDKRGPVCHPHHTQASPSRASGRMLAPPPPWKREKLTSHWRDRPALLHCRGARSWLELPRPPVPTPKKFQAFIARQHSRARGSRSPIKPGLHLGSAAAHAASGTAVQSRNAGGESVITPASRGFDHSHFEMGSMGRRRAPQDERAHVGTLAWVHRYWSPDQTRQCPSEGRSRHGSGGVLRSGTD